MPAAVPSLYNFFYQNFFPINGIFKMNRLTPFPVTRRAAMAMAFAPAVWTGTVAAQGAWPSQSIRFAAQIRADLERYAPVVKAAKITAEG